MWAWIAGGVAAAGTAAYLYFDSKKLRVGDRAFLPGNKAIESNGPLTALLPTLPEIEVLVTRRIDGAAGTISKAVGLVKNLPGGIQPEVNFAVTDVLRIVRGASGKPFPGGK